MADRCACAKHADGSVTTSRCAAHADNDPCETMAAVTGKRRKGSIVRGTCSNCGWGEKGRTTAKGDAVWLTLGGFDFLGVVERIGPKQALVNVRGWRYQTTPDKVRPANSR